MAKQLPSDAVQAAAIQAAAAAIIPAMAGKAGAAADVAHQIATFAILVLIDFEDQKKKNFQ